MITIPLSEYEGLKSEIGKLRAIIQKLKENVALLKGGRDSRTSSIAPSQDLGRSNLNSLRAPSGKKSGGQPGHTGHCLKISDTPDEIIDHTPAVCACCGNNLENVPADFFTRRQIVDIPPVRPVYTEHRNHTKTCPSCGATNSGVYPKQIKAPIQYGPVVESTAVYMSVFQYVSYNRIVDIFKHCFGLPLSEGVIDSFLDKMSKKAISTYENIRKLIQCAPVVGADETGCRVNGKKHWFHVWQTSMLTFIVAFARRSHEVLEIYFPDGFIHSFYVSDCYASQLKTVAKAHQLCIVHLLRELLNFEKNLGSQWSIKMKELFYQAMELKKKMTGDDYTNPPKEVQDIHKRLDELLAVDYALFNNREQAFIKRLIKLRNSILTFLDYENVPYHNNGSENAIRNVKVKTKVSGQFRNDNGKGADRYARIRSVIDTAIKNGQEVFSALLNIATGYKTT